MDFLHIPHLKSVLLKIDISEIIDKLLQEPHKSENRSHLSFAVVSRMLRAHSARLSHLAYGPVASHFPVRSHCRFLCLCLSATVLIHFVFQQKGGQELLFYVMWVVIFSNCSAVDRDSRTVPNDNLPACLLPEGLFDKIRYCILVHSDEKSHRWG